MAVSTLAALATTGTQWAVAASFGLAMAVKTFAISFALSAVSRALAPKPQIDTATGLSSTVKSPTQPRPILYGRTKTAGTLAYIQTTGQDGKYLHMVQAMAGHEIDAYEKIYIDDELAWDSGTVQAKFVDNVRFNLYLGDQTTADADLVSESNEWTSACVLNGVAYIYVRLEYDSEVFTNGIPNITAIVRGKKVYNPVADVTEWTQNPALCIADYVNDSTYGLTGVSINAISLSNSITACNDQAEFRNDANQLQYHDRYRLDGYIDTSEKISSNIENMLSAMFGEMVYSQGELYIKAGYYAEPELDIDESMMVGDITLQTKQSRRSQYNGVKGVFLSSEEDYILADYPSQISDGYAVVDGDPIYLDMTLPFTTDNIRAQRLAKLALGKSRQQRVITVPVNLVGLKIKAGDNIRITNEKLGLDNAVYQVVDYELEFSEQLKVNLVCVETGSYLYDWEFEDQLDFSSASDVELYDGSAQAPTNLNLTAGTNIKSDGTTATYIDASWTAPADVYFDYFEVTITPNGGSANSFTTKESTHRFLNTDDDLLHSISVRSYNTLGRKSDAITAGVTTTIDTTAPSDITGINISAGLQSITLDWTNPSEDDFDLVRIKVADTNTEPTLHKFEVRSDSFVHDIGAYSTTKHYWLAPVDRTGNVGSYVSGGSATTGSIDYSDVLNPPTIPEVATTAYLTLADNDAPTDAEFNTAVGRDPIENDFVVVNKEFAFNYNGTAWTAVTEFIDGSLLVTGSLSASDITTGTLNANDVTISNLTVAYDTQVTGTPDLSEFINGGDVNANVTSISGGVIQTGTAVTVGTSNNVAILSGADANYRIWAGNVSPTLANFKVHKDGTVSATNAIISGDITAGTINADNITFTGTLTADNLAGIPNVEAANMTQSMRNEIEGIIVTKFGSDASTGYYDEATGSFDAQDDNTEVCKISTFQHNGSNIDIDLTFSKAWQASSGDIPSVQVNIQRAPAGTTTWTTIKTQTITGSAFEEPELNTWFANIQGYVSVTDNPATGNYDYRFLTGNVLNLSLISLSAKLEANETGEQIGTIDLADYARIDQDETISGNYTFSGTTSGIDYGDLDNTPSTANWDTAYSWGNHASAGYLTTHQDISGKANLSGATFTGNVLINGGFLECFGLSYFRNDINFINAGANGFHTIVEHNGGNPYFNSIDGYRVDGIEVIDSIRNAEFASRVKVLSASEQSVVLRDSRTSTSGSFHSSIVWNNYQDNNAAYISYEHNDYFGSAPKKIHLGFGATNSNNKLSIGVSAVSVNDTLQMNGTTIVDTGRNISGNSISVTNDGVIGNRLYVGSDNDLIRVGGSGGGKSGVFGNRMNNDSTLSYGAYLAYDAYWNGSAWQANRTTLSRKWMTHIGGYHDDNFHINRYDGSASGTWADNAWTRLLTLSSNGVLNTLSGYQVNGTSLVTASRGSLYLNSSNAGAGQGIFFRDGFGVGNYNCSITVQDNNGGFPDGLHISGYDGVTIGTGSNERINRLKVDQAGDTTVYGNFKINSTTVIDSGRNVYSNSLNATDKCFINGGHSTSRLQLRYEHAGNPANGNSGFLTMWVSEPGITYDNCGIGGNINSSGQYYGRESNGSPYGVYLRFDINSGQSQFWSTTGSAGAIGGKGTEQFSISQDGYASARSGYKVGSTTVIDSSRKIDSAGRLRVSGGNNTDGNAQSSTGAVIGTYIDQYAFIDLASSHTGGSWIDFSYANGSDYGGRIRYDNSGQYFRFYANGAERFHIGNNINVLTGDYLVNGTTVIDSSRNLTNIGTVTTSGQVFINNNWGGARPEQLTIEGNFPSMCFRSVSDNHKWLIHHEGGGDLTFYQGAGYTNTSWSRTFEMMDTGDFHASGNITGYSSFSDIRLKDNIKPIGNALSKVSQLNGITFNYKKSGLESTGVIAQELEKVLPQAVYTTRDMETKEEYLAVNYGNTVGLLIEAIKELKLEVEELKNGNNTN